MYYYELFPNNIVFDIYGIYVRYIYIYIYIWYCIQYTVNMYVIQCVFLINNTLISITNMQYYRFQIPNSVHCMPAKME